MDDPISTEIALLLCGNGADLGDFRVFADDVAKDLASTFADANIIIKRTVRRSEVFQAILDVPSGTTIRALNVFSHSIGGGLYIGYHEPSVDVVRRTALNLSITANYHVTYNQVLSAEVGAVLTDHLIVPAFNADRVALRAKFAPGATAKLWGCNSGVTNWVYSDPVDATSRTFTSDSNPDVGWYYYWRALNVLNVPKPSIAQALADFLGIPVFGATSGAHIEVSVRHHWISSDQFRRDTGRWPGPPRRLRLHPDRADYQEFTPNP